MWKIPVIRLTRILMTGAIALAISSCVLEKTQEDDYEETGPVELLSEPAPAPHSFETLKIDFMPATEEQNQSGKADNAYEQRDHDVPVDYSQRSGHSQNGVPSQAQCQDSEQDIPVSECSETGDEGIGHGSPQPLDPAPENEPDDQDEAENE